MRFLFVSLEAPLIQADRVASRRLRGHDGRSSSTPSTWGNNDMGDRVEADFVTQADHERRTVLPACDEIQCILRPWSAAPADVPV